MNKKILATSIVILFLGLALAPSIHANIQQKILDSDLVEIITETCGLPNIKPQTVKLTREDADELDKLFDTIKTRLDNTETREETVDIFNEAIVELDKYGLIGELSVKQAQRLVTGGYKNPRLLKLFERISGNLGLGENFDCSIAGETTETVFIRTTIGNIYHFLEQYENTHTYFGLLVGWTMFFLMLSTVIPRFFYQYNPMKLSSYITLGVYRFYADWGEFYPSKGWVWTNGLNGVKEWDGKIEGGLFKINPKMETLGTDCYVGVKGFKGIGYINGTSGRMKYIGSASHVSINYN